MDSIELINSKVKIMTTIFNVIKTSLVLFMAIILINSCSKKSSDSENGKVTTNMLKQFSDIEKSIPIIDSTLYELGYLFQPRYGDYLIFNGEDEKERKKEKFSLLKKYSITNF